MVSLDCGKIKAQLYFYVHFVFILSYWRYLPLSLEESFGSPVTSLLTLSRQSYKNFRSQIHL